MKKLFIIGLLCLMLMPATVYAGNAHITWEAPTTNTDGTELTDLAGYYLYHGIASDDYYEKIDLGAMICPLGKCDLNYPITGNETHYFRATAYNTSGYESDKSNQGEKKSMTIPEAFTITVEPDV